MEVTLKLLGILFGVLARTLVPYLRKLKQGKVKNFKKISRGLQIYPLSLSLLICLCLSSQVHALPDLDSLGMPDRFKTPEFQNIFSKVHENLKIKQWPFARSECEKIITQHPTDIDILIFAYRGIANAYYGEGNFDLALATYKKALDTIPTDNDYWAFKAMTEWQIGNCLLELRQFDQAVTTLKPVLERYPEFDLLHIVASNLGRAFLGAQKIDQGLTFFDQLAQEYQGKALGAQALYQLAIFYGLRRDVQQTLNILNKVISEYPESRQSNFARQSINYLNTMGEERWLMSWAQFFPTKFRELIATINIDLDTLNLASRGKWVTVYIELPYGYDVSKINVGSVVLNNPDKATTPSHLTAEHKPAAIGDYDNDGIPDLMVKFDRASVKQIVDIGNARLCVSGSLNNNNAQTFAGSDTIRVIKETDVLP